MKLTALIKHPLSILMLACASSIASAGNVDIVGAEGAEIQKTVIGVWSENQKISFQSAGTYSIYLTDFGSTTKKFASSFNYLGAMISSTADNLASVTLSNNSTAAHSLMTFNITQGGDYWLSMFAITDSNTNVGTFNLSVFQGDVAPVPLPASFWLMSTSLLGFFSFLRQSKASRKAK